MYSGRLLLHVNLEICNVALLVAILHADAEL